MIRKKVFIIVLVIMAIIIAFILGVFSDRVTEVKSSDVRVTNVYMLDNETLIFKLSARELENKVKYLGIDANTDAFDNQKVYAYHLYMKKSLYYEDSKGYSKYFSCSITELEKENINAICYGTEKENIVIWKKGDKIPQATKKVRADYNKERRLK